MPVYATSFFASMAVRNISPSRPVRKIQHTIGKNETEVALVEHCLCCALIHDYKGTSFHGIYLSNLQKTSCIILRNLSGLSLFFFICHVPPAHSFFEKRSILESILLIIFSCSSMAGFISYQTRRLAGEP